jgi:hypothetical protein
MKKILLLPASFAMASLAVLAGCSGVYEGRANRAEEGMLLSLGGISAIDGEYIAPFYIGNGAESPGEIYELLETTLPRVSGSARSYNPGNPAGFSWWQIVMYCNKKSVLDGLQPVYSLEGEFNPDQWEPMPAYGAATDSVLEAKFNSRIRWHTDRNGYRLPTDAEARFKPTVEGRTTVFVWDKANLVNQRWVRIPATGWGETVYINNPLAHSVVLARSKLD